MTVPEKASFFMGTKRAHFVDFDRVEPVGEVSEGGNRKITYRLAIEQTYNFRTSLEGRLTLAGDFYVNEREDRRPELTFTEADYDAHSPAEINHNPLSNKGYESGDILLNINRRGHLQMNVGDTYGALAMRSWQLTNSETGNYFIEPDFHYTVLTPEGKESTGVIEISAKEGSAWADIKAVGQGTAIVLVSYDAINLTHFTYNGAADEFVGGKFWGAIWPENTAAYVVTVGENADGINPNMTVNVGRNSSDKKLSGDNVDAEHDVFYYLDTEEGASYTFTPEGVANVTIAYPTIGERMATYTGFGSEGVTKNADGSYTLLLKQGRQIVRLTDAAGKSVYQVLTAKPCHLEIVNANREGSKIFQPGETVEMRFTGFFHPANKLAGIYNMSAKPEYIQTYSETVMFLADAQYRFGSARDGIQTVVYDIPADFDADANPQLDFNEGAIRVTGFGDPYGNHRTIDRENGRQPNFTAVTQNAWFGHIPSVTVDVTPTKQFDIKVLPDVSNAEITLICQGDTLAASADGLYSGTYGTYTVSCVSPDYRRYADTFTIADDAEGLQTFSVAMTRLAEGDWDGKTLKEPAKSEDNIYQIAEGAELAWFAAQVNGGEAAIKAALVCDIELGNFDWTPIGSNKREFKGHFYGNGHSVKGLYIDQPLGRYLGLFGSIDKSGSESDTTTVSGVSVYGRVKGQRYVGGIAGYAKNCIIDRCANYAPVTGYPDNLGYVAIGGIGGITGYCASYASTLDKTPSGRISNCVNYGTITAKDNSAGIIGTITQLGVYTENVLNVGKIISADNGAPCVGETYPRKHMFNSWAAERGSIDDNSLIATPEQLASGEIAYKLGEAFGQEIGKDPYPVLGGMKVYYDEANDVYTNKAPGTTGIDNVTFGTEAHVELYYNLQGVASEHPWRGFNIVRMSDGTSRKVYIK